MSAKEPLRLVPFNAKWINHDKIDVHAIYRRPRFKEDEYGELERELDAGGIPTWDMTGPLPVKQHTKWLAKGFEYVTLADRDSLRMAGQFGTVLDEFGNVCDWRKYDQHQTGGPWNWKKYHEGQSESTTIAQEKLKEDILKWGPEAVEAIRRQVDPSFRLPDHMRNLKPEPQKKGGEDKKVTA